MKKHEEEDLDCDECDFQTKGIGRLNAHKKSKHAHHICKNEKCFYKTKRLDILKRHEKSCRAGIIFLDPIQSISEEEEAALFAQLKSTTIRLVFQLSVFYLYLD